MASFLKNTMMMDRRELHKNAQILGSLSRNLSTISDACSYQESLRAGIIPQI